jgi:predicted nucleic acid-binding protein
MPLTYFADTWYFVALLDPRDTHHVRANRLRKLVAQSKLVTHEGVLTEVLAYFADAGSHARMLAAQAVRHAQATLLVEPADHALFQRALDLYEQRPDKEFSLVDCMSMVLMEERGIRHVLTNDHHFTQAGFSVVSE